MTKKYILSIICVCTLSACGQKGPLYLPNAESERFHFLKPNIKNNKHHLKKNENTSDMLPSSHDEAINQ